MGELRDSKGKKLPPFTIKGKDLSYLTLLDGANWQQDSTLTSSLKLDFKRSKVDFKIIKKESTPDTKYELFQRLNTGGSFLTPQEIRNCLIIMANKDFFKKLEDLSKNDDFIEATSLSENQEYQAYRMELVTRFVVLYAITKYNSNKLVVGDVNSFFDKQILQIATDTKFDFKGLKSIFDRTFDLICTVFNEDAFRKFNVKDKKHKGGFSIALYEFISIGLAHKLTKYTKNTQALRKKVEGLASDKLYNESTGSGVRGSQRITRMIPYSLKYF